MDLLFENIDNERIGDTGFINHYAGVNNSMLTVKLKPAIRQATRLNILKWIDKTYYDALYSRFDGDTLTNDESAIIDTLQDAIAHYAIAQKMDEGGASLSELGLHYRSEETAHNIPQWQFFAAKYDITKKADLFLETFLSYVYENEDGFTSFAVNYELFFIESPKQLTKYLPISASVMLFFNLLPSIRKVSESDIKTIVSATLYNELLTAVRANTELDETKTELVDNIRKYLSLAALFHAIPFLNIDLSDGKLINVTTNDGYRNRQTARDNQINPILERLRIDIETYKQELIAFINTNRTDLGLTEQLFEIDKVVESGHSVGLF